MIVEGRGAGNSCHFIGDNPATFNCFPLLTNQQWECHQCCCSQDPQNNSVSLRLFLLSIGDPNSSPKWPYKYCPHCSSIHFFFFLFSKFFFKKLIQDWNTCPDNSYARYHTGGEYSNADSFNYGSHFETIQKSADSIYLQRIPFQSAFNNNCS